MLFKEISSVLWNPASVTFKGRIIITTGRTVDLSMGFLKFIMIGDVVFRTKENLSPEIWMNGGGNSGEGWRNQEMSAGVRKFLS